LGPSAAFDVLLRPRLVALADRNRAAPPGILRFVAHGKTAAEIRAATDADRDAVHALMLAQFREHHIDLAPDQIARSLDGVLRRPNRGRLLVATLAGRCVGLAALSTLNPPTAVMVSGKPCCRRPTAWRLRAAPRLSIWKSMRRTSVFSDCMLAKGLYGSTGHAGATALAWQRQAAGTRCGGMDWRLFLQSGSLSGWYGAHRGHPLSLYHLPPDDRNTVCHLDRLSGGFLLTHCRYAH
jgi:hypothetical protein